MPRRFCLFAALSGLALVGLGVPAAAGDLRGTETVAAPPVIDYDDNSPWTLPTRPPRCSDAQIALGDVRACLIDGWARPDDQGWGTPPVPERDSVNWLWTGANYNGSPALADWEATMVGNAERISRLRADRIDINAAAAPLFHGFLAEIAHYGYELRSGIGYSFRCTRSSGGWDCPNGIGGLSFHAWGLALDINADTNPIVTYRDPNGGSACTVEMATDMPEWVIQTAEKWGLYWGGYGWGGDCTSPGDTRSSTFRDPPHFEFRGTPELAERIVDFNLRNDPTIGCYEVVADDGSTTLRCNREFAVEPGWRVAVNTNAPSDAIAAVINLTATGATGLGSLSVDDCSPREPDAAPPSFVHYRPDGDAANLAVVTLGDDGRICIGHSSVVSSIVDVVGFIMPPDTPGALRLQPLHPRRLEDTRPGEPLVGFGLHSSALGVSGTLLANVTTVSMDGAGFVSSGACDLFDGVPHWSNVNYSDEAARANLAIVEPGVDGNLCTFTQTGTHLLIDVLGELGTDGLGFTPSTPRRVLDTRRCDETSCTGVLTGGELHRLTIGDSADAVLANVTVIGADQDTFLTVAACSTFTVDADGTVAVPNTSTVNVDSDVVVANLALTTVDDGDACVYSPRDVDVIIDVQAELSTEASTGFVMVDPVRVFDGRAGI